MSYQSWSVVFGEQPSAAKWNILGTNDASFNDGTGIGSGVISPSKIAAYNRQNDDNDSVANTTTTAPLIQYGWVQINGAGAQTATQAITFPTAYSAAPVVIVGVLGAVAGSNWTNITTPTGTDNTTIERWAAVSISTTGFTIQAKKENGQTLASGTRYGGSWIAIGPS